MFQQSFRRQCAGRNCASSQNVSRNPAPYLLCIDLVLRIIRLYHVHLFFGSDYVCMYVYITLYISCNYYSRREYCGESLDELCSGDGGRL